MAKPAMLFQSGTETTANSTANPLKLDLNKSIVPEVTTFQYMAGVCLALTASLCGAISGITTNELKGNNLKLFLNSKKLDLMVAKSQKVILFSSCPPKMYEITDL